MWIIVYVKTSAKTTTAKRLLRSVDRATLVTMNPPASHALAAASRDTRSAYKHSADTYTADASSVDANYRPEGESAMTTIELDRELEELHNAAVWSLNAALESGWDDAASSISKSYALEERTLLRRWRRTQTAA